MTHFRLTLAQTPLLMTRGRSRPTNIPSKEEREEQELAEHKAMMFRAKGVGETVPKFKYGQVERKSCTVPGVLLLLVLDLPSLGTSMFVPSLLGVILANLGLFLTLATAASTWALRAALLGVMTLGAGAVTLPLSFWVTEERVCCKTEETDLPYLLVAA